MRLQRSSKRSGWQNGSENAALRSSAHGQCASSKRATSVSRARESPTRARSRSDCLCLGVDRDDASRAGAAPPCRGRRRSPGRPRALAQRRIRAPRYRLVRRTVSRNRVVVRAPLGHVGGGWGRQATAVSAFSSSPNFALATNCPTPGDATSSSPSTSTWPRRSTTSGVPVTSVPS